MALRWFALKTPKAGSKELRYTPPQISHSNCRISSIGLSSVSPDRWETLVAVGDLSSSESAGRKGDIVASLLLVAMPFAPSSFLFLVAMPGAPSSVLAPSSAARSS